MSLMVCGVTSDADGATSDAAMFDMEYMRWLEEHHRLMCELRAAVQEHQPENHLRMFVDSCLAHHDQMVNLKNIVIRSDVFHLISGVWMTPAERCFMWMGGFRPSELIKVLRNLPQTQTFNMISCMHACREHRGLKPNVELAITSETGQSYPSNPGPFSTLNSCHDKPNREHI